MENYCLGVAFQTIVVFLWPVTIKVSAWFFSMYASTFHWELLSKEINFQVQRADGNIPDVSSTCMHLLSSFLLFLTGQAPLFQWLYVSVKQQLGKASEMKQTKRSLKTAIILMTALPRMSKNVYRAIRREIYFLSFFLILEVLEGWP